MLRSVTCPGCGRVGDVESTADAPGRCPACGGELGMDDRIAAWLAPEGGRAERRAPADRACLACGFEGPVPRDPARAVLVCPACGLTRAEAPRAILAIGFHDVRCPDCGHDFAISEDDRGRTTICPACRRFLGCLLPVERPRRWRRLGRRRR